MTEFPDKLSLLQAAQELDEYWSPRVVAEVNDSYVKVSKIQGEFVWHQHDEEDELFYILQGRLLMQYEDRDLWLEQGEMHVVPRGVRHNPVAEEECLLALVERKSTLHTGDVNTERTRSISEQLGE